MPLFTWIRDKASDVVTFTSQTYAQIKSGYDYVTSSPNIKKYVKDTLFEGWKGFSTAWNPEVVSFLGSAEKTRQNLASSVSANLLLYMGSVLLYEGVIKRGMRLACPDLKDSYAETAMDTMATWYFIRSAIAMFVQNTFSNSSLNRAISTEAPKKQVKPCHAEKAMKADFADPLYFVSKLLTAKFAEGIIPAPFGTAASTMIRAAAYGETLVGYDLAELCTKHRIEVLTKNNAFSLGLGLSFLSAVQSARMLVRYATGADNYFIYDALFFALFEYYMVAVRAMKDPLPGKTPGIDFFYHSREAAKDVLKKTSEIVIANLPKSETRMDWPKLKSNLLTYKNRILNFPLVSIPSKLFLVPELKSFDRFAKLEGPQYLLNTIQKKLEWLMKLRSGTLIYYIPGIFLSHKSKLALEILLADGVGDMLKDINNGITNARFKNNDTTTVVVPNEPEKEIEIPLNIITKQASSELQRVEKIIDDEKEESDEESNDSEEETDSEEDIVENKPKTISYKNESVLRKYGLFEDQPRIANKAYPSHESYKYR